MDLERGLKILPIKEAKTPFTYAHERWNMEERMERVREACRIANCLDFIEKWDHGFDTVGRQAGR